MTFFILITSLHHVDVERRNFVLVTYESLSEESFTVGQYITRE